MSRHPEAVIPAAGQESVWDYPRAPRIEPVSERIVVKFGGVTIADTCRAFRILETSHPPVYYLPPQALQLGIVPASGNSFCEFKGIASSVSIVVGALRSERAGWRYNTPTAAYSAIAGFVAFYASRVDEALIGDERVIAQAGDFYGGWIAARIVGPCKGAAGTHGW